MNHHAHRNVRRRVSDGLTAELSLRHSGFAHQRGAARAAVGASVNWGTLPARAERDDLYDDLYEGLGMSATGGTGGA